MSWGCDTSNAEHHHYSRETHGESSRFRGAAATFKRLRSRSDAQFSFPPGDQMRERGSPAGPAEGAGTTVVDQACRAVCHSRFLSAASVNPSADSLLRSRPALPGRQQRTGFRRGSVGPGLQAFPATGGRAKTAMILGPPALAHDVPLRTCRRALADAGHVLPVLPRRPGAATLHRPRGARRHGGDRSPGRLSSGPGSGAQQIRCAHCALRGRSDDRGNRDQGN